MTPIERLFALEHFGIKLGLAAMHTLLTELGQPHRAGPSLHIAGTNGKGSVSAMTSAALTRAGLRVGRYTSPHLFRVEERIALDGDVVSDAVLAAALGRVFGAADALTARGELAEMPTFFEVSTAAAFVIFARAQVDVAVIEVGLGGRFDATNVIAPVASAITTIDFDHERHLGTTIAAIAREKAGIAKAGVPLVVGDVPDEAWHMIQSIARQAGAPVTRAGHDAIVTAPLDEGHARLTVQTPAGHYGPLRLGLAGAHQAGNALVAIRLLEAFAAATGVRVPAEAVSAALADVRWPARLEWLRHPASGARVLVDAAHNPAGARALSSYLASSGTSGLTLVTSVMDDKNVAGVVGPLLPFVDRVVVTAANLPRATAPAVLAAQVTALGPAGLAVEVVADPARAVARALMLPAPVLLTGSIYLVGPQRAALVASGFEGP
jgi:dihydrofolate synthase/folylpolyglutamate synthase